MAANNNGNYHHPYNHWFKTPSRQHHKHKHTHKENKKRSWQRASLLITAMALLLLLTILFITGVLRGMAHVHQHDNNHNNNPNDEVLLDIPHLQRHMQQQPARNNVNATMSTAKNAQLVAAVGNHNHSHNHSSLAAASRNTTQKTSSKTTNSQADAKTAYVFYLGGIPHVKNTTQTSSSSSSSSSSSLMGYKGLLYNILVSTQILRDSGSQAHVLVMVQMAVPKTHLPLEDAQKLHQLGIQVLYIPSSTTTTSVVNDFSSIVLEKFRVLQMTQYQRILYLDADLTPRCNLDYLVQASLTGTLRNNVIISIGPTPASGSFFVLTPSADGFRSLLQAIVQAPGSNISRVLFDPQQGWGSYKQSGDNNDADYNNTNGNVLWNSLATTTTASRTNQHQYQQWTFEGAENDQGLLYYYTKYLHGNVSQIIGSTVEHYYWSSHQVQPHQQYQQYQKHSVSVNDLTLTSQSCLFEHNEGIGKDYRYKQDTPQAQVSPANQAPYRDFVAWRFLDKLPPWNRPNLPVVLKSPTTAVEQWSFVLRQLDERYRWGLFDLDYNNNTTKDATTTSSSSKNQNIVNWKYIPAREQPIRLDPMWSTKLQPTRDWARHLLQNETLMSFVDDDDNNNNKSRSLPFFSTDDSFPYSVPALAPPFNPNNIINKTQKRAFVCITGQLERLELKNKITKILIKLQKRGWTIDVALVLSSGNAEFTNPWFVQRQMKQAEPFYTNYQDAVADLQNQSIHVIISSSYNGTYLKLGNPPVHEQYLDILYKAQQGKRTLEEQRKRVQNHARILESYQRCLTHADAAARQGSVDGTQSLEQYYDVIMRFRDDVGLDKRISRLPNVIDDLFPPPPNSIIVTECRGYNGMNDRMAVVSPDIARLYFQLPYDAFVNQTPLDAELVSTPESFLLQVFLKAKIHVWGHINLKRVLRVVRTPDGIAQYVKNDQRHSQCPEPYTYLQRLYELYGWTL